MSKRRVHPKARRTLQQTGSTTCAASGRKVRYPSRRRCLQAINVLKAHRPDIATKELRAYKCEHCRDWHFTSSPERTRNEGAER